MPTTDDVVRTHARLAHFFANKFIRKTPPGISYEEVHAAVLEGIWRAVRSWREDGGASFSTFAAKCCWRSLSNWLRTVKQPPRRQVALPISLYDRHNSHEDVDRDDEIRRALQAQPVWVRPLLSDYYLDGLTVREVAKRRKCCVTTVWRYLRPYQQRGGRVRHKAKR